MGNKKRKEAGRSSARGRASSAAVTASAAFIAGADQQIQSIEGRSWEYVRSA